MPELAISLDVCITCPGCGNDDQTEFEFVAACTLIANADGVDVPWALELDGEDHKEVDFNAIARWRCSRCSGRFAVIARPSWPGPASLQAVSYGCIAAFDAAYRPECLFVGDDALHVHSIEGYQPPILRGRHPLFEQFPFGTWTLRLQAAGRCVLSVHRGIDTRTGEDTDGVRVGITAADEWASEVLGDPEKRRSVLDRRVGGTSAEITGEYRVSSWAVSGAALPPDLIGMWAHRTSSRTEARIRQHIWRILASAHRDRGSRWWNGVLDAEHVRRIIDRASQAFDRAFQRSEPCEYLTVAEVREIVERKWQLLHASGMIEKDRTLAAFDRFADRRNPLAHGRSFTMKDLRNLEEASCELVQRVELAAVSDTVPNAV